MFRNMENLECLAPIDRAQLVAALRADGRRMLFRRGANALAARRYDFATAAADALAKEGNRPSAALLEWTTRACEKLSGVQSLFTAMYRALEWQRVRSRRKYQRAYGHLLRTVEQENALSPNSPEAKIQRRG